MATIIECPNCAARYEVPATIPKHGRKVRCAKCTRVWTAQASATSQEDDDVIFRDFDDEPEYADGAAETAAAELDESAPSPSSPAEATADTDAVYEVAFDEDDAETRPDADRSADLQNIDDRVDADDLAYFDDYSDSDRGTWPRAPAAGARAYRGLGRARLGWAALALMLLAGSAIAYLQRVEIVRAVPGMAQLYGALGMPVNVRGLKFEDVGSSWTADAGQLVLEVRGEVVNVTATPLPVPTVLFLVRDDGAEEIFRWAADIRAEPLPGGERTRFVARVPAPSKGARSLQLRFVEAR